MPVRPEIEQNARDVRFVRGLHKMFSMADIEKKEEMIKEVLAMSKSLEERYSKVMAQMHSFVDALYDCRRELDPNNTQPLTYLDEVSYYANYMSNHLVYQRICNLFFELVTDLDDYRKMLLRLGGDQFVTDYQLNKCVLLWKKVLDPQQDIHNVFSPVAVKYVNKLSNHEKRKLFRGVICVLPIAMDCMRKVLEQVRSSRSYLKTWKTFTTCDEMRRLVEYNDSRRLRRDRRLEFKRQSKWAVPDKRAAKVRLDDALLNKPLRPDPSLLPDAPKNASTQRGTYENRPKRQWGYDRCREKYDRYGFPVRFSKRPDSPPKEVDNTPRYVVTAKYSPNEILKHVRGTHHFHHHHQHMPHYHPHHHHPSKFSLRKEADFEKSMAAQTKTETSRRPHYMPYKQITAGELDDIVHGFVGQAAWPEYRTQGRHQLNQREIAAHAYSKVQ